MTRYYKSFNAETYPLKPIGQIDLPKALELATYYSAKYDTDKRLVEFTKHVRSEADWTIAFEERYQYWRSGKLRIRELVIPGRKIQKWEYETDEVAWTRYLSQLCSKWFGSTRTDALEISESALLFHELITEFEFEIFRSSVLTTRNAEWAHRTVMSVAKSTKSAFERVAPYSNPMLHAVAEGEKGLLNLAGFDEPHPNLFGVVGEWLETNGFKTPFDVNSISIQEDFGPDEKVWAQRSEIESITVGEVMANSGGRLVPAFNLYLTLCVHPTNEQAAIINSLFRRAIVSIQWVIDTSRVYETSQTNPNEK